MTERFKFRTPIRVRYADTDMQGHVFFANYLTYFDQALTDYLKVVEYGYKKFLDAGIDFFYVDTQCTFKGSSTFDDLLHVHARLDSVGRTSFTFRFTIFNAETDAFVASGRIVAVAVDRKTRRPVPVPEGFKKAVEVYEGFPVELVRPA